MVLKRLSTASSIPNDHNPPPKRASSLLGSSRTYSRPIPISIFGRKAKIVWKPCRRRIGCRRNWDRERMLLRERQDCSMMLPLVLVMLPNRALTGGAFSLSSYFSAFFVCADLLVYQDRHNSGNVTLSGITTTGSGRGACLIETQKMRMRRGGR